MTGQPIATLEQNLRYTFSDPELAETALRHRSYIHEQPEPLDSNERLEFLGDAVLSLVISLSLMERFPEMNEGNLSRLRASLVNENRLAAVAESIDLGDFVRLGKGERQSSGREKKSILADAFEALIAAVYLDGGMDRVSEIIDRHFSSLFDAIAGDLDVYDYKSRLQELTQERFQQMPEYTIAGESGPDHDKTFQAAVTVSDIRAEGRGKSKKAAEQAAAKKVLEQLEEC